MNPPPSRITPPLAHVEAERRLEVVQRTIVSALVGVVFGSLACVLAAYLAVSGDQDLARDNVIGLWVMTGVVGLITMAAVLLINQRPFYSPWILVGVLPMAVSAFWVVA